MKYMNKFGSNILLFCVLLPVDIDVIAQNVNVNTNILMRNSTATRGNILKEGIRFIHNFGTNNTFVGVLSGNFSMRGTANTGFGAFTLRRTTGGTNNTAFGANTLRRNVNGSNNTGFGFSALVSVGGTDNTAIGSEALSAPEISTSSKNTAAGKGALGINTIGTENVAVGNEALFSQITGGTNTAVGTRALQSNISGSDNVAVGANALQTNFTGSNSVAIGASALSGNTRGSSNTVIGTGAALSGLALDNNTVIGHNALAFFSRGNNNTVVGSFAGVRLTSGSDNIFLGDRAGTVVTNGEANIIIGSPGASQDNHVIRIGDVQKSCFIAGIFGNRALRDFARVVVSASGQLGTVVSSRKYKHSIKKMDDKSEDIYHLEPVAFVYNDDENAMLYYGLIAAEVDEVFPALVVRDECDEPFSVRYDVLPVLLLNELKKENRIIENNEQDISMLKDIIVELQEKIQSFMAG